MPSIRDDISKITAQVSELNKEAREASLSTKSIGNSLKFDSTNVELIKKRFASLRNELEINNKKLAEMQKASKDLEALKGTDAYKNDAQALQKINKLIEDYKIKIQYAIDKQKELESATDGVAEKQAIVNAVTQQVNEKYSKLEQTAQKVSRATTLLVGALTRVVKSSIETGREIYSMSQRFNSSAEDVQIWNRALELATGTQDIFNDSMKAMIQGMSQISAGRGIAYNNVLKEIGINYSDIASLSPTEQFEEIVNALSDVENYSMRASYAQQLFQEKGVLLAGALDGGTEAIERFKEQAKEFGIISDKNAKRLTEIGFELEKAKSDLSVVSAELTIALVPVLQVLTTLLKVASPILSSFAEGLEKMGIFGGIFVTVGLSTLIIMPKLITFSKLHAIAKEKEAQAIQKVTLAQKMASAGLTGWIGLAVGAIGIIATLIGAFGKATDEADKMKDSVEEATKASQEIVGGNADDFVTTTETMATKSTYSEITINATIRGEGDNPISDENAVLVAQLTADEVNKNLGDLIK